MTNMRLLLSGAAVLIAAGAQSDTLFFKDGSTLDGKVSQPNPNVYLLDVEGGRLYFQANEVSRWEENDKMGKYNVFTLNPRQIAHEERRQEETGLTAEQIEEMYAIMEPLASGDPNEVEAAKQALLAKNEDVDLFNFLTAAIRDMTYKRLPAVLEVMTDMDPERAKPILEERATDTFAENRSKAITLLAKTGGEDNLDTMARGMLDLDPTVQTTAAEALAAVGDKRATPALLQGLRSADMRVKNASAQALKQLWSDDGSAASAQSVTEWERIWSNRQSGVRDPVQIAQLEPLVTQEAIDQNLHYDE
jgi:hypothetical protein